MSHSNLDIMIYHPLFFSNVDAMAIKKEKNQPKTFTNKYFISQLFNCSSFKRSPI